MSEPESIVASGIPQFTGDLDSLDHDTALLTAEAGAFRDAGAGIHSHFQGVAAFYKAPEAEQLFATTAPVAAKTATFADNLEKVSSALSAYSQEVRPLAKKLEDLQRQAFAFTASIAGDEHWRRDEKKRDRNDGIKDEVHATLQAFYEAEITCHNKITALVGGTTLALGNHGDKKLVRFGTIEYGATADDLSHLDKAPWGSYAEPEYTGLNWLWHQGKSLVWDGFIVDGVWGTVKGLGTLVGTDGWDAAGQAWTGLGKLATGLVILSFPGAREAFMATPDSMMPKWFRDSRTALKETGKALIAYDEWGKNPARATGAVAFNVLTTVFTGGAGSAAKTGAVAKTVSALGKVGRAVDPMTYVFKAGQFGVVKVADVFKGLKGLSVGPLSDAAHLTHDPNVPHVTDTYAEWSDGTKLSFKDGEYTVTRPDGTKVAAHVELSADQIAQLKSSLPHEATVPGGALGREHAVVGANQPAHFAHDGAGVDRAAGGTAHDVGHSPAASHQGAGGPHGGDSSASGAGHTGGSDYADGSGRSASGAGGQGNSHNVPGQNGGRSSSRHAGEQADPEVARKQLEKANTDEKWRREYYEADGTRKSRLAVDENGNNLAQIRPDPDNPGKWVLRHDRPLVEERMRPAGRDAEGRPIGGLEHRGPDDVNDPATRDFLDRSAKLRHLGNDLNRAEKAHKNLPTPETAGHLDAARHAFEKLAEGRVNNSKIAEEFGEATARLHAVHAVPERFEIVERLDDGSTGSGTFDQVYLLKNERILLVEAKAPNGKLIPRLSVDGRMRVKQGTREYVYSVANAMEKKAGGNLEQAQLAERIITALEDGKLDYILVRAVENSGTYNGFDMEFFDTDLRTGANGAAPTAP